MDERPEPVAVGELLARARAALTERPDDAELRQAYDQLVADRTNGEALDPGYERLTAALGSDH